MNLKRLNRIPGLALRAVPTGILAVSAMAAASESLGRDTYDVTAADGRHLSVVRQQPGRRDVTDVRGADGRRLATVERSRHSRRSFEVREADGSRRVLLRRSPLVKDRLTAFNDKGERVGYWQRSGVTGEWHRHGTDGRLKAVARRRR